MTEPVSPRWRGNPGAGDPADAVAVAVLNAADGSLKAIETGLTRGDESAIVTSVPFAEREAYTFHVVAYRPGATPADAALATNSSVGFDGAGAEVVCSAADRQAALAAANQAAAPAAPAGALV